MDENCCGGTCGCSNPVAQAQLEPKQGIPNRNGCPSASQSICACDSSDDGFSDDCGEDGAKAMMSMDRMRLEEQLRKVGYVEGITYGREQSLQEGFDKGIKLGSHSGMAFGYLVGQIRILEMMRQSESQWQRSLISGIFTGESEEEVSKWLREILAMVQQAEKEVKLMESSSEAWKPMYWQIHKKMAEKLAGKHIICLNPAPGMLE